MSELEKGEVHCPLCHQLRPDTMGGVAEPAFSCDGVACICHRLDRLTEGMEAERRARIEWMRAAWIAPSPGKSGQDGTFTEELLAKAKAAASESDEEIRRWLTDGGDPPPGSVNHLRRLLGLGPLDMALARSTEKTPPDSTPPPSPGLAAALMRNIFPEGWRPSGATHRAGVGELLRLLNKLGYAEAVDIMEERDPFLYRSPQRGED
jgi:hypothetical protein